MRISILALTAATVALIVGGTSGGGAGQKQPSFKTPNWRCSVEFRDRDPDPDTNTIGDAIRSDGLGPYIDGTDGVTCYIYPGTDGALRDGWLSMIIESPRRSPSPRFIQFIGQEYSAGVREHRVVPGFCEPGRWVVRGDGARQGALAQPRCHSVSRAPQPLAVPLRRPAERGQQHRREPMEHPARPRRCSCRR